MERLQVGTLSADLVQKIKTWGSVYGQAAIETLTLVAFQDTDTLEDMLQHEALKGVLVPFAGANRPIAVIPQNKVAAVQKYLRGLGVEVVEGIS